MSDNQEFQSAQKECSLQIVNVNNFRVNSISPRKKNNENNIGWKFQKIKRIPVASQSPAKVDTKNISFQTDYLEQASDEQNDSQNDDNLSRLTSKYKNYQRVFKKQKMVGSSWLGNSEYFASVFIDPSILAKSEKPIFKNRKLSAGPSQDSFTFNSNFESGNLFAAYKVAPNQYDLILQNDINSKGNTQWFYFQVSNIPGKTKVKFNIVNLLKSDSLFNYGMQPVILSQEAQKRTGQGWFRSGTGIKYYKNENKVDGSHRFYYTLSFTIMTPYDNDTLKIAHSYPYTIQNLNFLLDSIQKKPGRKAYTKRQSIGQTLGKNNIQVIKILQQNPRKKGPRQLIIITARQHPGETPSSYACQGFLDFITSDDKEAAYLRKNYEVVVFPMLNPDGVQVGNYRTNLCGVDLNRRWDGSKSNLALETLLVKKYLIELSRNREVAIMIDLHGHSRKLFSFFYGNASEQNPFQVRLFPYICSKSSELLIRFQDSTFVTDEAKRKTARVQMASKFKIPNVFTFQMSFFGYINKNKERVHYTQQKLKHLGVVLARAIFLHERYKNSPDSPQTTIVKKYLQQLSNRPELIRCGQKGGSGSETEPQKGEINEKELQQIQDQKNYLSTQQKDKKRQSKAAKKETIVKEISKQSRQMHVMDIARVNSIFPNDVLALMPSSFTARVKDKEKIKRDKNSVMVQTEEVPVIKIYDICKFQEREERDLTSRKKIAVKNEGSNLFRTVIRPKSSNNSYLQSNLTISVGKNEANRKQRHESGMNIKEREKKKVCVSTQTSITFPPETDFMAKTLDSLMINPISKGFEIMKKKINILNSPQAVPSIKTSTQSFKIGLRALNVETWRIKKKSIV